MICCDGVVVSAILLFYLNLEYKNNLLYTMYIQNLFNPTNLTILTKFLHFLAHLVHV